MTNEEIIEQVIKGKRPLSAVEKAYFVECIELARIDEQLKLTDNRNIENIELKVPVWYRKDHMKNYLLNANYSEEIAEELAEKWAENLQQSFRKGFERGVQYISGRWVNGVIVDDTEQQPQGVKVWVSWGDGESPRIAQDQPEKLPKGDTGVYYQHEDGGAHYFNYRIAQALNLEQGQCKPFLITELSDCNEFSGTRLTSLSNEAGMKIAIGCISPEASELLDKSMEEWEKHFAKRKENNPKDEPSIYGFAYWLIRWSGLVRPAITEVKDDN